MSYLVPKVLSMDKKNTSNIILFFVCFIMNKGFTQRNRISSMGRILNSRCRLNLTKMLFAGNPLPVNNTLRGECFTLIYGIS